MLARIQALFEPAQRFAADAAHELRTPLTALRGEPSLLSAMTRNALDNALWHSAAGPV